MSITKSNKFRRNWKLYKTGKSRLKRLKSILIMPRRLQKKMIDSPKCTRMKNSKLIKIQRLIDFRNQWMHNLMKKKRLSNKNRPI